MVILTKRLAVKSDYRTKIQHSTYDQWQCGECMCLSSQPPAIQKVFTVQYLWLDDRLVPRLADAPCMWLIR